MVMTLREHADIESEGARSPYQERVAALHWRVTEAAARRDREDRRMARLFCLERIAEERHRVACADIAAALEELRGMRA